MGTSDRHVHSDVNAVQVTRFFHGGFGRKTWYRSLFVPSILFDDYLLAYCFRQSRCSSLCLLASMQSPLSHARPQTPNSSVIDFIVEYFDPVGSYLNLAGGVEVLVIMSKCKLKQSNGVLTSRATLILWPVVEIRISPCLAQYCRRITYSWSSHPHGPRHEDRSISTRKLVSRF